MNQTFLSDLLGVTLAFLSWTLMTYWLHRLAHIHSHKNPLWRLHRAHHKVPYLSAPTGSIWPKPGQFVLWLGNWRTSLDVIVLMTVPAILITLVFPRYGIPLLIFHYFYELFCSEYALDHNPKISGTVTKYFAWGDFHLYHHIAPKRNFGLMVTFWDRVFGTATDPPPGTALTKQTELLARKNE